VYRNIAFNSLKWMIFLEIFFLSEAKGEKRGGISLGFPQSPGVPAPGRAIRRRRVPIDGPARGGKNHYLSKDANKGGGGGKIWLYVFCARKFWEPKNCKRKKPWGKSSHGL